MKKKQVQFKIVTPMSRILKYSISIVILLIIIVAVVLFKDDFLLHNNNEKVSWGSVNKKFIELEKTRADIFIEIKNKETK